MGDGGREAQAEAFRFTLVSVADAVSVPPLLCCRGFGGNLTRKASTGEGGQITSACTPPPRASRSPFTFPSFIQKCACVLNRRVRENTGIREGSFFSLTYLKSIRNNRA